MEKPFPFPAACDIIMYYCILEVPHMEKTRREIMDRVYLTYLPAKKFKTSCLSAQFITPLRRETASYGALLPLVLQRGTMSCPDIEQLSAAMDQLYGAQINPTIRKRAECQCIGFVASVMDDSFAPPGRKAAGAHRRPAGGAAAGPRHPQRPVSGGICGQRAGQPAGQHPLHPQR